MPRFRSAVTITKDRARSKANRAADPEAARAKDREYDKTRKPRSAASKKKKAEMRKIRRAQRSPTQVAIDAAKKKAGRKPLTAEQKKKANAATRRWQKANPHKVRGYLEKAKKKQEAERALLRQHDAYEITYEQKVKDLFAANGIIFESNKFVRFLPHATRLRAFVDLDILSPPGAPRLMFECDEKQHKPRFYIKYDKAEELERPQAVHEAIGGDRDMVFIRYNPSNDYRVNGVLQVEWNSDEGKRFQAALDVVKECMKLKCTGQNKLRLHTIGYDLVGDDADNLYPAILDHPYYDPENLPEVTFSIV